MDAISGVLDAIAFARLQQRRRAGEKLTLRAKSDQADCKSVQLATRYQSHKANYWHQVKTLLIIILSLNCLDELCYNRKALSNYDDPSGAGKSLIHSTVRLTKSILQVAVLAAAATDSYADASAESPSVDALEDEDEDDEELDASASNEYPEGDNDNDESYDDSDGK